MKAIHQALAKSHPKLERGRVWCTTCGHTETVDATRALTHGWPRHCGYTMTIDSPVERAEWWEREGRVKIKLADLGELSATGEEWSE